MRVLSLAACLLLSGCLVNFSHPTKSKEEFNKDLYECERDAAPVRDRDRIARMIRMCMESKGYKKEGERLDF